MDDRQSPGRRQDGLVVPTLMAGLLGGLGVLAVALAGSSGYTEALSGGSPVTAAAAADGLSATVTGTAAGAGTAAAGATALPTAATTARPTTVQPTTAGATALPAVPGSDQTPAPVEAITAPPPIQITP